MNFQWGAFVIHFTFYIGCSTLEILFFGFDADRSASWRTLSGLIPVKPVSVRVKGFTFWKGETFLIAMM